ncbi:MAG TPA: hypothetical protein PKJ24_05470 [Prolixibacteraceae bacterium]|nr:hypothetical protein [Prolixibacteraceae bacterium]HPT31422.1 hypothetical protein [Prolixibacteraceae bacterium]
MKKLFFVLALVAVYALSATNVYASVNVASKAGVTVVADDKTPSKDDPKKADVKKETPCAEKQAAGCCAGKAEAKECPHAKAGAECAKTCGGEKEVVPAKKK